MTGYGLKGHGTLGWFPTEWFADEKPADDWTMDEDGTIRDSSGKIVNADESIDMTAKLVKSKKAGMFGLPTPVLLGAAAVGAYFLFKKKSKRRK